MSLKSTLDNILPKNKALRIILIIAIALLAFYVSTYVAITGVWFIVVPVVVILVLVSAMGKVTDADGTRRRGFGKYSRNVTKKSHSKSPSVPSSPVGDA